MAAAEENGNGLEFLTDPVDRFPWPDLETNDLTPAGEAGTCLTQSAAESSMGDVGDNPLSIQLAVNNGCEALSLSAADSQQSTRKDDPQAPGWTRRYPRLVSILLNLTYSCKPYLIKKEL
ncbi:unnamed protein product [Triticum turgidum subsp. durum]|uniref:Uncharacterized protein n=1 Tax=Triticum turgidum subsp. durum TaxID=4567 RepID=A0A9R0YL53_TRITD|nr:unnamed protein product [Triticum turgidum subsp. durum]